MELTAEQLKAAGEMSLQELRELALKEEMTPVQADPDKNERPRDAQGRFLADQEPIADTQAQAVVKKIYRKEIANGDGSFDVYESDDLQDLVNQIAEGKLNANIQLQKINAERKAERQRTEQQTQDELYVTEQNLKTKPVDTIKELARQTWADEQAKLQRSNEAQEHFVAAHPDFITNPDNAKRITAEVQRLGYAEMTVEGLEKAYQSLKASGLLKLKDVEASDATEDETQDPEPTVQTPVAATSQRSPQSSGISTRSSRTTTPRNPQPTEDDLYKMPMDQLRKLTEKQIVGQ